MNTELALLIAGLSLVGNAFFVGAEFGLISARRSSIDHIAKKGSGNAKKTLRAMENVTVMLAGAQLGITLCTIILGAVAEPLIAHFLEGPLTALGFNDNMNHLLSFAIALTIATYIHVVVGEMVPKNLALTSPEKVAIKLVPILAIFVRFTRPVVLALNNLANVLVKIFGISPKNEITSHFNSDEVAEFIDESSQEGLLSKEENLLLTGALKLKGKTIKTVTIPYKDLVYINATDSPEKIESIAASTGFSRFPVLNNKNIVGYLHIKDVIKCDDASYSQSLNLSLIRPLVEIAPRTYIKTALDVMKNNKSHMALVKNKKGQLIGAVTLEDLLEEFVGKINDNSQKA